MPYKNKLQLIVVLFICFSAQLFAAPVHTWHTVSTDNGIWEAKLQMLNEGGNFVDMSGHSINTFTISPQHPTRYGFSFAPGADFDVAYTLTIVQKDSAQKRFVSKACVYIISATGPAKPDIRVLSYNGASCWTTSMEQGGGTDFFVQ